MVETVKPLMGFRAMSGDVTESGEGTGQEGSVLYNVLFGAKKGDIAAKARILRTLMLKNQVLAVARPQSNNQQQIKQQPMEEIEADLKKAEEEILRLLRDVTA